MLKKQRLKLSTLWILCGLKGNCLVLPNVEVCLFAEEEMKSSSFLDCPEKRDFNFYASFCFSVLISLQFIMQM